MPSETYQQFVRYLRELHAAEGIEALLDWDQETCMPPKAAGWRAEQLSLIAGIIHERKTSHELGTMLEKLETEGADGDPIVEANVREARRDYDKAVKLPTDLVRRIAHATTLAKDAWAKARKASDFGQFAPHLEKLLDLKREVADHLGWKQEPYDALIDLYEPGATTAEVAELFGQLKPKLVGLVEAIREAPRKPDESVLKREAPVEKQKQFNRRVIEAMGFDFEAGRLDISTHPFCTSTCPLDVRMTTRYDEHYLPMSLFGVMHETGHGLYEQGLNPEHTGTPCGQAVSLGIHESQSRLWENQVGRSRAFWEHWFEPLKQTFSAFADVSLDAWHFAINTVKPSLIRVEADEVTYGLHIILRFELERLMVQDKLKVSEIPQAWNDSMQQLLGITPPDDAQGCLQDIHWSMGTFGYFPTYQLGNLYSAQIFQAARRAIPDLDDQIRRGELLPLRDWLRENVHQHGRRYRPKELIRVVTGSDPSPEPYIEYLNGKFRPLYGLA